MRRPLLAAVAITLFAAAVASSGHSAPDLVPQAAYADTNGVCAVNPSPLPTVGPNTYTPVLPACSQDRHLQVDVIRGGGSGTSATAPPPYVYASPYPSLSPGAQTAGTVDSAGRIILSPVSSVTVANTPAPVFVYASPFPTLAPGTYTAGTVDSNGFQIISPLSIIRGSVGIFNATPAPLVDGQSTQILTDINGRPRVAFDTPQPVYLAPENKLAQRGAQFYTSTAPQLFADADSSRRGMYIQNQCANPIWLSLFGDVTTLDSYPNIEIRPGQLYTTEVNFAPTAPIYVFSRSTSCGFAGATF